MYTERRSRHARGVLWTSTGETGQDTAVVPDGCTDVMWIDQAVVVAGPDTRAHHHERRSGEPTVGLRFDPGVGPTWLGVPAVELRDRRVRLDALWSPALVDDLTEQLAGAADPATVLERAVASRFAVLPPPDAGIQRLVTALRSGTPVAAAAELFGRSDRQLRRVATQAFGYSAKTLQRILRFQHGLALARQGLALGAVAHEAGYCDQAHMAREVRELAGVPMTALLSS